MTPIVDEKNAPYFDMCLTRSDHLQRSDPQVQAAVSTQSDRFAVIGDARRSSIELVQAACEQYASRPFIMARNDNGPFEALSYANLWRRVVALGSGAHHYDLYQSGDFVGIFGFASPDWVVADLACLFRCAVSVPLRTAMVAAELISVIQQANLRCVICSQEELPTLAAILPHCPCVKSIIVMDATGAAPMAMPVDTHLMSNVEAAGSAQPTQLVVPDTAETLVSLCYTSGSTASPKGAMLNERVWRHTFTGAMFVTYPDLPGITFGYTPLNHIAGRNNTYRELHRGGTMYFAQKSDMSTLFDDLRLARPLYFMAVPRVAEMVFQQYQAECVRRDIGDETGRVALMREMSHMFGDRLCLINTGTAPSSGAVLDFCRACFQAPIVDGYGSTENGVVAFENRIVRPIISEYRLRDVPELRYYTTDKPYPRGELCVRSSRVVPGYYANPEATEKLFDADGWMLTGDVVEERGPDHIVWIDRRHNISKLSNGEFVSASHLETTFIGESAFIEQMYVYVNGCYAYPLAVVVPNMPAIDALLCTGYAPADVKDLLRSEIARVAQSSGLQGYEVPRDFLVDETVFTQANGRLTESAKPSRPNLRKHYQSRLEALYCDIETRALQRLSVTDARSTVETLCRLVAAILGTDDIQAASTFKQLGGDSISAVQLHALIERHCDEAPSVGMILDSTLTIEKLAAWIDAREAAPVDSRLLHGTHRTVVRAEDLRLERFVCVAPPLPSPKLARARHVLLTGATGFLGRCLLNELLIAAQRDGGKVTCLVRAGDDAKAWERIQKVLLGSTPRECVDRHLAVYAGDFALPRFGLIQDVYERLANEADSVLHNGALVNHALSYAQLFEPNVVGTAETLRFALYGQRKCVTFLSTTGILNGLTGTIAEATPAAVLWPERNVDEGYAAGYCTSKWASEILLEQFEATYQVPTTILRSGLLLAHRQQLGVINPTDFFTRLVFGMVHTGLAPSSFYAGSGPEPFDALPVDFVAHHAAKLSLNPEPGLRTMNMVGPASASGPSLDQLVDWIGTAGYRIERVSAYEQWFTQFKQALDVLPGKLRAASPWPILHQWESPQRAGLCVADNTRFLEAAGRQEETFRLPRLDEAFMHQCLRHMQHLDMIVSQGELHAS